MKTLLIVLGALLTLGIGYLVWRAWQRVPTLDTSYGTTHGDSINGLRTLRGLISARATLRHANGFGEHLDDVDVVVHVRHDTDAISQDELTHLYTWLISNPGRRALVVLRAGGVGTVICERWAAEARGAGDDAGAQHWQAAATGIADARGTAPTRLSGPWAGAVPLTLRLDGGLLAIDDDEHLLTLHAADGELGVWAAREDKGLYWLANATPILDGALADPAARWLLQRVVDDVLPDDRRAAKPVVAWLRNLAEQSDDDRPGPHPVLLLFQPPFSWGTWHLLALLALIAGAGALWLGRRSAPTLLRADRFSRHVDALAHHLKQARGAAACLRPIARLRDLPEPPTAHDDATARDWLRQQAQTKETRRRP